MPTHLQTATVRDTNGAFSVLRDFSEASYDAGTDINNLGQVVGWSYTDSSYYALLWDTNGHIVRLGEGSQYFTRATDINNYGQIAWTQGVSDGKERAYRWDNASASAALPLLDDADSSIARAINDSGWVVGSSGSHAVFWNGTGSVTDLGTSTLQWGNSANGINNRQQIVGELGGRAVLWDANGSVPVDLDSLLDTAYGSAAYAINDHGWIAGYRLDEYGNAQAVVWEPVPEPSSLLAVASGMACILPALRRRRS